MRKIVDLTETTPGVWGMALRLMRRTPEEIEARREAFFDSLAGESTKKRYAFGETGGYWFFGLIFGSPIIIAMLQWLFR